MRAARDLLETDGENFTMTMLAKRLGVAVSSLYNHVASRDEVFAKISDDVVRGIDVRPLNRLAKRMAKDEPGTVSPAEAAAAWRAAAEKWARSYYRAFAAQPSVVATLALTPVAEAPQTLMMYETVAHAFLAAGWPESEVLLIIETLESFLLGTALDAAAPADIFHPGDLAADYPIMSRLHDARSHLNGAQAAEEALDVGLSSLLNGLEQRLREALTGA
ncbi:TetR/AcrR family transcriptional regulator [Kocuria massiliensis]|uniref:TetR/AcrR family transcriptional regulator n=1 Tax=Kocuria massiliensis TaxID=1926282 RepID=UPI0022B9B994|nr:TetR/AcrR family transcriptional regulator C-terminal domain-containing protein [Kocuria massiliensis]